MPFPLHTGALKGTERIALFAEDSGNVAVTTQQIADLVAAGSANLATADLTASGDYTHDWDNKQLIINNTQFIELRAVPNGIFQLTGTTLNFRIDDVGINGPADNLIVGVQPGATGSAYLRFRNKEQLEFHAKAFLFKDGNTVVLPSDNPAALKHLVVDETTGQWYLKDETDITQAPGQNLGTTNLVMPAGTRTLSGSGPTTLRVDTLEDIEFRPTNRFRAFVGQSLIALGTGFSLNLGNKNIISATDRKITLHPDELVFDGSLPFSNGVSHVLVRDPNTGQIGINTQIASTGDTNLFSQDLALQTSRNHQLQQNSLSFTDAGTLTFSGAMLRLNFPMISFGNPPALPTITQAGTLLALSGNGQLALIDPANLTLSNIATADLTFTANRLHKGGGVNLDMVEFGRITLRSGAAGASLTVNGTTIALAGQNGATRGYVAATNSEAYLDYSSPTATARVTARAAGVLFDGPAYAFNRLPPQATLPTEPLGVQGSQIVRIPEVIPQTARVWYDRAQTSVTIRSTPLVVEGNQSEESDASVMEAISGVGDTSGVGIRQADTFVDVSAHLSISANTGFTGTVELWNETTNTLLASQPYNVRIEDRATVFLRWAGVITNSGQLIQVRITQTGTAATATIENFELFVRT